MKDPEEAGLLVDHRPDALEVAIRAICGAPLGGVVGVAIWVRLRPDSTILTVLLFVTSVSSCAWGAFRYGDDFWTSTTGRFRGFL